MDRGQALSSGLTPKAITHRLRVGTWQALLPSVYLTRAGEPSRYQQYVAAMLYAGPTSAVDGADACRYHGLNAPAGDGRVFVVVPDEAIARSREFLVVRRTTAPIAADTVGAVRYVDAAMAVIAATRRMRNERAVLAALSEALQRRVTTYDDLVRAHTQGPPRNSRLADAALAHLGAGTRSAPEADFRQLALASAVLPPVDYNVWLRLPTGRVLCVDALIASSAVVHETNGRSVHAREDLFEDLQERHDTLTAAGFTVLHSPPSRLRLRGREVISQIERCHLMYDGRGLPQGVEVIRSERHLTTL